MRGFFWNSFRSRASGVAGDAGNRPVGRDLRRRIVGQLCGKQTMAALRPVHVPAPPGAAYRDGPATQSADPNNQVSLRSSWDLRDNVDFDMMARYVDELLIGSTGGPTDLLSPLHRLWTCDWPGGRGTTGKWRWWARTCCTSITMSSSGTRQLPDLCYGGSSRRLWNTDMAALMIETSALCRSECRFF